MSASQSVHHVHIVGGRDIPPTRNNHDARDNLMHADINSAVQSQNALTCLPYKQEVTAFFALQSIIIPRRFLERAANRKRKGLD